MVFCPDSDLFIAKYYNHTLPVILGVDENIEALEMALENSFNCEGELGLHYPTNKYSINRVLRKNFDSVRTELQAEEAKLRPV